ncbi:LPXTG cell wall anchor domain-containing protein [Streptococcus iniae]|uniref:LPXTG cell wall anchor domain-containing protein n=1 Tax=Streptococcus iniae TaxID=1346 RepID=UPI0008D9686E|nr:LPXTG cell wall anchor domain-containing protein [Streptococcus iniae]OHX27229.1 hypothetical protein BKX95_06165 [Streptococcus iniae]RLV27656.1 LPXTG cell wall anchor domain-containing protein [Streptococcus iniae]
MKKEKIVSLVAISSMALLGGSSVLASTIDAPSAGFDSEVIVPPVIDDSTSPVKPPVEETPKNPTLPPVEETPVNPTPVPVEEPSKPTPPVTDNSTVPSVENKTPEEPKPSVPATKPVTKPVVDAPIETVTNDQVVGTQDGKVVVQTPNGTVLKEAKEVGGELQKDGTVVLKKSDGGMEVLPSTGDNKTFITLVGLGIIIIAVVMGFKDNIKKYLTLFKKKTEK